MNLFGRCRVASLKTYIEMERVVIVGPSCSGKTTMARRVAAILQAPHIELDAIHWLPGWQERDDDEFRELTQAAVAADRWVVDGNYAMVRDIVWPRATTVVWLNYSFPVVLWRAFRRTLIRSVSRQTIFSENKETIRRSFFSRESILLWVFTTYRLRRKQFRAIFDDRDYPEVEFIELRSQRDANQFLTSRRDI